MNYRHAFHAGNHADVLKHAVLAQALVHLARKDAAFRVIDTHAGIGLYDLSSDEAQRTGEWRGGIGRIRDAAPGGALAALLEPLLGVVEALNPEGGLRLYPGSPEIARRLSRPQDRLVLCERHPEDFARLKAHLGRDRRVRALHLDGWMALKANLPPKERRGVVLVDPPFEQPGEFLRLQRALAEGAERWRGGAYLMWYPVKNPRDSDRFAEVVAKLGLAQTLRIELWLRSPRDPSRLNGSGLIAVNPPWTLERMLQDALPELAQLLGDGPGARGRVECLIPEAA